MVGWRISGKLYALRRRRRKGHEDNPPATLATICEFVLTISFPLRVHI